MLSFRPHREQGYTPAYDIFVPIKNNVRMRHIDLDGGNAQLQKVSFKERENSLLPEHGIMMDVSRNIRTENSQWGNPATIKNEFDLKLIKTELDQQNEESKRHAFMLSVKTDANEVIASIRYYPVSKISYIFYGGNTSEDVSISGSFSQLYAEAMAQETGRMYEYLDATSFRLSERYPNLVLDDEKELTFKRELFRWANGVPLYQNFNLINDGYPLAVDTIHVSYVGMRYSSDDKYLPTPYMTKLIKDPEVNYGLRRTDDVEPSTWIEGLKHALRFDKKSHYIDCPVFDFKTQKFENSKCLDPHDIPIMGFNHSTGSVVEKALFVLDQMNGIKGVGTGAYKAGAMFFFRKAGGKAALMATEEAAEVAVREAAEELIEEALEHNADDAFRNVLANGENAGRFTQAAKAVAIGLRENIDEAILPKNPNIVEMFEDFYQARTDHWYNELLKLENVTSYDQIKHKRSFGSALDREVKKELENWAVQNHHLLKAQNAHFYFDRNMMDLFNPRTWIYRRPDARLVMGNKIYLWDLTTQHKIHSLPQIRDFFKFTRVKHVTIIRPTDLCNPKNVCGSYTLTVK